MSPSRQCIWTACRASLPTSCKARERPRWSQRNSPPAQSWGACTWSSPWRRLYLCWRWECPSCFAGPATDGARWEKAPPRGSSRPTPTTSSSCRAMPQRKRRPMQWIALWAEGRRRCFPTATMRSGTTSRPRRCTTRSSRRDSSSISHLIRARRSAAAPASRCMSARAPRWSRCPT